MSKSNKVDVQVAAISGVKVVRWWRSKELWNYIASTVLIVTPLLANGLASLGLDAVWLLAWTVGVAVVQHGAGAILKMTSTTMIGGAIDVSTAKAAVALQPEDHENVGASDVR